MYAIFPAYAIRQFVLTALWETSSGEVACLSAEVVASAL